MGSTCGKLHKRWLFAPGEEKQLQKHVPVKVAKEKTIMKCKSSIRLREESPPKKHDICAFQLPGVIFFVLFWLFFFCILTRGKRGGGVRADHSRQQAPLSGSSPESIKADNRANNWERTAIMDF